VAGRIAASKSGHIASVAQEGVPALGMSMFAAAVATEEAEAVAKAARIEAVDVRAGSAVAADIELVEK